VLVSQVAIVIVAAFSLPPKPAQPTTPELVRFFVITVLAIATLIIISAWGGPKPRWRWGKKPTDNPDEDF